MSNINPVGVFGFGGDEGQFTPITGNNIPVNTALQNLQLAGAQGFTGLIGITGTLGIIGNTGSSLVGNTGLVGDQGITGAIGVTGLVGATGILGSTGFAFNATGLQGITGIQGATGIAGLTGVRGFTGTAGLQGETGIVGNAGVIGLTGFSFSGVTGLPGETGIAGVTGIRGITGPSFFGTTGVQGITGLIGATGFQGTLSLEGRVAAGNSISFVVTANTITTTGQQIEFYASGTTAEAGVATTVSITFGGVTIFSDTRTGFAAERFTLEGLIIKQSGSNQEIGIKALYDGARGNAARTATTLSMASNQTLTVSVSSVGGGESIYTLIVRRVGAPDA
jgi:hypothetical protein